MDYFEIFGIVAKPVVDIKSLGGKYISLQKKYHPDFHSHATEEERKEAEEMTAAVNKAYRIFSDPNKTLEYFLQVKGAIAENEKFELPADFLMEMMELNELMDDGKAEEFEKSIRQFSSELESQLSKIVKIGRAHV